MEEALYRFTVCMTNDNDGPGVKMEIEGTPAMEKLMENFDDYSEIHENLVSDIMESVGAFFENLLMLQGIEVDKSELSN